MTRRSKIKVTPIEASEVRSLCRQIKTKAEVRSDEQQALDTLSQLKEITKQEFSISDVSQFVDALSKGASHPLLESWLGKRTAGHPAPTPEIIRKRIYVCIACGALIACNVPKKSSFQFVAEVAAATGSLGSITEHQVRDWYRGYRGGGKIDVPKQLLENRKAIYQERPIDILKELAASLIYAGNPNSPVFMEFAPTELP